MQQTGLQNPIFGIMQNQGNNMGMNPNTMGGNMNTNMNGNMGFGMPNQMNNNMGNMPFTNMNQMGMTNGMNCGPNQMMMNPQMMMMYMMNANANMNQNATQFNNQFCNMGYNNQNVSDNTSNTQDSSNTNGGYSINFRKNEEDGSIIVQCVPTDKMETVIERYYTKSQDPDKTKKFIFNAKEVNKSLTVADLGINNNCTIFVVTTKNVKGA